MPMKSKAQKKSQVKVRDLKPTKDAKGGTITKNPRIIATGGGGGGGGAGKV
jgi:hypothetical protein